MRADTFDFGSIRIDGTTYAHDVVLAHGEVRRRKKKASKPYREGSGHTPLSLAEDIPWDCRRLIIGTGAYGSLPVLDEVKAEAARRGVELVVAPTPDVLELVNHAGRGTHAILHVTC